MVLDRVEEIGEWDSGVHWPACQCKSQHVPYPEEYSVKECSQTSLA